MTSALVRGEWSASRTGRFIRGERAPPVPIEEKVGWTPESVWTLWRRENSWAYRASDPSVVQTIASRYTDYAIPALRSDWRMTQKHTWPPSRAQASEYETMPNSRLSEEHVEQEKPATAVLFPNPFLMNSFPLELRKVFNEALAAKIRIWTRPIIIIHKRYCSAHLFTKFH
jgi:hypothetical protein